jgi:hypothetical protein
MRGFYGHGGLRDKRKKLQTFVIPDLIRDPASQLPAWMDGLRVAA